MSNNYSAAKTNILEHWFGIDRVLFGKDDPKKVLSEEKFVQYTSTKSAFLSNLFELYVKLDYSNKRNYGSSKDMKSFAKHSASLAVLETKQLFENADVKSEIFKDIKELSKIEGLTESEVAPVVVAKNYKSTAIDCLTIGKALEEACSMCINDWDGKIKLQAHRSLRDKLVEFLF